MSYFDVETGRSFAALGGDKVVLRGLSATAGQLRSLMFVSPSLVL